MAAMSIRKLGGLPHCLELAQAVIAEKENTAKAEQVTCIVSTDEEGAAEKEKRPATGRFKPFRKR
jgi:hypothetical protein